MGDDDGYLQVKSHHRSDSGYSNNYSLLEMYGDSDEDPSDHSNVNTPDNGPKVGNNSIDDSNHGLAINDGDKRVDATEEARKQAIIKITQEVRDNAKRTYIKPLNHQTITDITQGNFDRYGFKKVSLHQTSSKDQYNAWFKNYSEYCVDRKSKWEDLLKANGLATVNHATPMRFPPKSDKVKKLIRRGIPGEWRGNAWFFYAGGYEKLNKHVGIYDKIVKDTIDITNKDTEAIERDLNRTFPDNIHFNSTLTASSGTGSSQGMALNNDHQEELPMIKSLRRVLVCFSHYQPQIGYCQSLNFLAGLLLLFMNEERVFWMLVILTERIIPKVHSRDLEGVHTDQGVLMLCIKEYIPTLWATLGRNFEGETLSEDKILTKLPPVTLVTSSWFMSVFVGILPVESVLRIWDILWYEGSKTLFRFSLTICKMCLDSQEFNPSSKNSESEQIELFQFMQSYPKLLLNPNDIIDNCFKKIGGYGYGSLSQAEINKCREFVAKQRDKLTKKSLVANLSEDERRVLLGTQPGESPKNNGSHGNHDDDNIHDVYGFHRSIMSGVAWNNNISNKVKKRFSRKSK